MGRYSGKSCRLLTMVSLTASFFLVEIIVGYLTGSLALVADSYHMLSDVIALLIGFASVRISKWRSQKNTYGWARAEVLGALVNAVFLIALCFTILVEALQRLFDNDYTIEEPDLLLIVGGIGLGINVIGLFLFGSHSHGGHGHSHGGGGGDHGHSHEASSKKTDDPSPAIQEPGSPCAEIRVVNGRILHGAEEEDAEYEEVDGDGIKSVKIKSAAQLNMRGVFLHVLGDALGSIVVIISALCIKYLDVDWKFKIDPAMSIVLVVIILSTSIPLLKESAMILLQTVPTHIQVKDLKQRLMDKVSGVMGVHEFHVWQLTGNRIIASAHIHCQSLRDYMRIAEDVKSFFHNEGIHSTTIQPEFVEASDALCSSHCLLDDCCRDQCAMMKCCEKKKERSKTGGRLLRLLRRRSKSGRGTGTGDGGGGGGQGGVDPGGQGDDDPSNHVCLEICDASAAPRNHKHPPPTQYGYHGNHATTVPPYAAARPRTLLPGSPAAAARRGECRSLSADALTDPAVYCTPNGVSPRDVAGSPRGTGGADTPLSYIPTFRPPTKRPVSMYTELLSPLSFNAGHSDRHSASASDILDGAGMGDGAGKGDRAGKGVAAGTGHRGSLDLWTLTDVASHARSPELSTRAADGEVEAGEGDAEGEALALRGGSTGAPDTQDDTQALLHASEDDPRH